MELVNLSWIMIALFLAIVLVKILIPEISYKLRLSLIIAIVGALIFASIFVATATSLVSNSLIFCGICLFYIYKGGKTVALKTMSGVFSKVTKKSVGIMNAGSLNWACPIFEVVTVSVDGIPNKSADLQKLKVTIHETPPMQTAKRGIQAKIKHISFMLVLDPDRISDLLEIEGGAETIQERIVEFSEEFFLEQVADLTPEALDQDKKKTIDHLKKHLWKHTEDFCDENGYPYHIVEKSVVIGDTELDAQYYEALARKEYAKLEQDAKDVEAIALRERISKFGKDLLPGASKKEQTDKALIALAIVKKDISEKRFGIDPEIASLAKDLAKFFQK